MGKGGLLSSMRRRVGLVRQIGTGNPTAPGRVMSGAKVDGRGIQY